jgi:hypothetical protein
LDKILEEIGFKIEGSGPYKKLVGGKKSSLNYLEFARTNVPPGENTDPQAAAAIMQGITIIASNAEFTAAVGVGRIIKMLEQVVKFSGGPSDYDLTSVVTEQQGGPALMAQLQPVLEKLQAAILQQVGEKVARPAAESAAKQEQQIGALEQAVQQLSGIYKLVEAANNKNQVKMQEMQTQMQIDTAKFQAEQQRLQAETQGEQARLQSEHEAQMRRDAEKAQLDTAIVTSRATVELQTKEAAAAADIELARAKSESAIATKAKERRAITAAKPKKVADSK